MPRNSKMRTIVITKHPTFVEALRKLGLLNGDYEVYPYIKPQEMDVLNGARLVVNPPVPLKYVARAKEVLMLELQIPPAKRNDELTTQEVLEYAKAVVRFKVQEIERIPLKNQ